MTQTETEKLSVPDAATTIDDWTNVRHDPVLPSGRKVVYRDVSLVELAQMDALPDDLLELVLAEWAEPGSAARMALEPLQQLPEKATKKQREEAEQKTSDIIKRLAQVNEHLIALALVDPICTVEDLQRVPLPDLEMLAALISRRITHDAVGRHVGVVPLDSFRVVLETHGVESCPPDCAACATSRRALAALL